MMRHNHESNPMRFGTFICLMICLVFSAPVLAQKDDDKFPAARNAVVTSVQKCLNQLDPVDAAEIKGKFVQPYQECQRRLSAKLERKKQEEAKAAAATPVAVTPRNFVRVKQLEEKNDKKKEDKK
jgi:hypothetical protein